jgi:NADH-quinone oxidoreductase subunit D
VIAVRLNPLEKTGMFDYEDTPLVEIKHLLSERALTGETIVLNMGPQHPSTHGVLRLIVELEGEMIVNCIPDVGFLHTGVEKNMESKTYLQAEVMTDRLDYMNTVGNNLVYCMAIEKLAELDVPPRAQVIRVIVVELQRIASHLLWMGTHALDLGAITPFWYNMREREMILDILEMVSGQRMMTTYIRPGGIWRDVPVEFEEAVRHFTQIFPKAVDEYESMLTNSPIFKERTKNIGILSAEDAMRWGVTGPMLRASGVSFDLRKAQPYMGYDEYDFDIPTYNGCDVYSRYLVRVEEMRQSNRIVEQALNKLPYGPVLSANRKYVPPPRSEIGVSMEALIHHFKLWTEGFSVPKGSVYAAVESPRGELGVFLESDGGPNPYRVHFRTPSFMNLQSLPLMSRGRFLADMIGISGSLDYVLGDVDR